MQYNAHLDDLCKRLLAPFTPLLQEVERLLNATVAEERAVTMPPLARTRNHLPTDSEVAEERAVTMPPLAAKMPRRGDSPVSLSSHPGGDTGRPAALGLTIQSVRPAPSAASDTLARIGTPGLGASIKPATTVPASDRRPTIRLMPRVVTATPGSAGVPAGLPGSAGVPAGLPGSAGVPAGLPGSAGVPAGLPGSAGVPAGPGSAAVPAGPGSAAVPAGPGSAAVPAGLPQTHPATGEKQALSASPPHLPPASTVPTTAPAHRQGITLIPRPVQQTAARLVNGVESVLERAYRLTQSALNMPAPEPLATQETPTGQVHNTFNVAVSLNSAEASAGLDREALQEALVELLRTAARRQGLEI
ncbi:MAG: hypothetical protein U1F76_19990 [Candidatus Competibacteraceae bacterium]